MLKCLAILTVFGTFLLGGPSVAENQQSTPHTAHNVTNPNTQPAQPANPIVYGANCCQTEPADTKKEPEENPLPRFLRAEWGIVYVTIICTLVAWYTLRKIAQQASIMEEHAVE